MPSSLRLFPLRRAFGGVLAPLAAALLVLALAGACTQDTRQASLFQGSVEVLYNNAMDDLLAGRNRRAIDGFEAVEREHPYSFWATRAQIMGAYAHYQSNDYDEAIVAARRFIELHPGNADVPYAYYLIAISYYEQISDVGRDQRNTQRALQTLREVVRRFPDSPYARDARLKIDLTRDHLAGKEMAVGRFYQKRGLYIAAINRYRRVVEQYQTTTHVPEALHRLAECYLALGITDEAQTAAAVLGYNYPGSEWYRDSYALLAGADLRPKKKEGSWLARAFEDVF